MSVPNNDDISRSGAPEPESIRQPTPSNSNDNNDNDNNDNEDNEDDDGNDDNDGNDGNDNTLNSINQDNIDIKDAPAFVDHGAERSNCEFSFTWHQQTHKAFMKLHATVTPKSAPTVPSGRGRRRGNKNKPFSIYLFIYPEFIEEMSMRPWAEPDGTQGLWTINVSLTKLPLLIGPLGTPLDHSTLQDGSHVVIDAFKDLACRHHFTVNPTVHGNRELHQHMQHVCTIITKRQVTALGRAQDTSSLYNGKGGVVVSVDTSHVDDELEPQPKRRRSNHSLEQDKWYIETVAKELMRKLDERLDQVQQAGHNIEERIAGHITATNTLVQDRIQMYHESVQTLGNWTVL